MRLPYLTIICASLFIFSCNKKEEGCKNPNAINFSPTAEVSIANCQFASLSIPIELTWGSLPFEVNRIYNLNGRNTAVKVFRAYWSNFRLSKSGNTSISTNLKYYLLDANNLNIDFGTIETNQIDSLSFGLGIDSLANANSSNFLTDNTHPLQAQAPDTMHWNNGGYIFLKISGKVDRNGDGIPNENESFSFEIGTDALYQTLSLPTAKILTSIDEVIPIQIDILSLFDNVDLQTEQSTNSVDNPSLAQKIATNWANAIQIKP